MSITQFTTMNCWKNRSVWSDAV